MGGVVGAIVLGNILGYKDIITTDVGGTSFDVGLIVDGEPEFSEEPVIAKYHLLIPMVNVTSIGAGGGSIAWIEPDTGILRVGPKSAGADPGPVCYGLGGIDPTVTDADLILGRINPDYFLGGRMRVDKNRALSAIKEKIAQPLGMDPVEASMGIVDIIDSNMADLVRKVTVGKGYDPRDFVLFSFGGAGPTHVGSFALDVGAKFVVIPSLASVFSAFGIARSDVVHIRDLSDLMTFPPDAVRLGKIYKTLEENVLLDFKKEGVKEENILLFRTADIRYKGQVHEVRTPIPMGSLDSSIMERIVEEYERLYERKYGKGTAYKKAGIEAINYRVRGVSRIHPPFLKKYKVQGEDPSEALKGVREVYFRELGGFRPLKIYDKEKLKAGNRVEGPAIIEGSDTTVVIHPGQGVKVDEYLNLIMTW